MILIFEVRIAFIITIISLRIFSTVIITSVFQALNINNKQWHHKRSIIFRRITKIALMRT